MDDNLSTCSKLSWGSQLTQCESFEAMLSSTWTNLKLQKKVMELVISLRNTIQKNGGTENATEFYAALISLMKRSELGLDTLEACGYLMKALLASDISAAVLRHTTGDMSKIASDVLTGVHGQNENVTRFGLLCLSKVLMVQSEDNWRLDNVKHMYRMLFAFTSDSRPKINAFARKGVLKIFESKTKAIKELPQKHPLNKETLAILTNNIRQQNIIHNKNNDYKNLKVKPSADDDKLSFSLTTLSDLLHANLLSQDSVVSYVETLIQCLLSMQIVPIQCQILLIFERLFKHDVLSPEVVARSLTSLFAYINLCTATPAATSVTSAPPTFIGKSWLNSTLAGFECLLLHKQQTFIESTSSMNRNCRDIALMHALSLIRICSDWLLCDDQEMKSSSNEVLKRLCSGELVKTGVVSDCLDVDVQEVADVDNWLLKCTETLGRHLSTQHELLWPEILDKVSLLVERSRGRCPKFIDAVVQVLPKMAELRDGFEDTEAALISAITSTNFKNVRSDLSTNEKRLKSSIEGLIGQVMRSCGLARVLSVLPLSRVFGEGDELSNRTWMVPLIRSCVQDSSPQDFTDLLLPLIGLITSKMDALQSGMDTDVVKDAGALSVAVASLGTLRYQVWSCLPSFAKSCQKGGIDRVSTVTWGIILDLLDQEQGTGLEAAALSTIRNLTTTARDPEEARRVLTTAPLFPRALQLMFVRYSMPDSDSLRGNIRMTLNVYLALFEPTIFDPNVDFLLTRKLAAIDTSSPSDESLRCVELLTVLAPHLTTTRMAEAGLYLERWLDDGAAVDAKLQKRVYRYLETVSAGDTPTSNEHVKEDAARLADRLYRWREVCSDSWKSRMRTLLHLLRLARGATEARAIMNRFVPEIVGCLGACKRTAAVAGLLLVEGVLACEGGPDDGEDDGHSLDRAIDRVLQWVLGALGDGSGEAKLKKPLTKALALLLCEPRLSRGVTSKHVEGAFCVVQAMVAAGPDMARAGLAVVQGLLRGRGMNYSRVRMADVGACLVAVGEAGLLKKVRTQVRAVLRRALRWWPYTDLKAVLPDELLPVLRNLHKAENRSNRSKQPEQPIKAADDASSWAGASEAGTMRQPHIRSIVDILEDSDSENEGDGASRKSIESRLSQVSLGGRSEATTATKATELRKMRKRKVAEANAMLFLEEKDGEVIDISDPLMLARHTRVSKGDGDEGRLAPVQDATKRTRDVDKRGFRIEDGRLLIGVTETAKEAVAPEDSDDESDVEGYQAKKGRFQPPKTRVKKQRLPGAEFKAKKKGVFGDMKKSDGQDPYAFVPLKGDFKGLMTSYERQNRKCLKATRKASKVSNKKKGRK